MPKQLSFDNNISFGDAFGGQFGFDNDDLDKQIESYKQHDNSNQSDYELDAPQSTIGKGLQSEDEYFDNFDSSDFDEQDSEEHANVDNKIADDTKETDLEDFEILDADLSSDDDIPDDIELDSSDDGDEQWSEDESWINDQSSLSKKEDITQDKKSGYIDENSQLSFDDKARLESIVNGSKGISSEGSSIKPEKIDNFEDSIEKSSDGRQRDSGYTQGARSYGSKNLENSEVDNDIDFDDDPLSDLEKSLDDEDSDEITEIDLDNDDQSDQDEDDSWLDDSQDSIGDEQDKSESSESLDEQLESIDFGDDLDDLEDEQVNDDNKSKQKPDVQSLFAAGTVQKPAEPQEDEEDDEEDSFESLEKDLEDDEDQQESDEDDFESLEKDLDSDDEDDLDLSQDSESNKKDIEDSNNDDTGDTEDSFESLEKDLEDDDEDSFDLDDDKSIESNNSKIKEQVIDKNSKKQEKAVQADTTKHKILKDSKQSQKKQESLYKMSDADRERRIAEANKRAAELASEMKANKENKKSDIKIPEHKKSIAVPQQVHLPKENNVNKNKTKRKLTKQEKYALLTDDRLVQYVEQFLKEHGVQQEAVDRKVLENEFGAQNIQKLIRKSRLILIKNGITMGI